MSRPARLAIRTSAITSALLVLVLALFQIGEARSQSGETRAFLLGERFRVTVQWADGRGNSGSGMVVPGTPSEDTALFSFFDEDNWELMVKVLNGCELNDRVWVFSAGTTNVQYTIRVRDMETGQVALYNNTQGQLAETVNDTNAFASCAGLDARAPKPTTAELLAELDELDLTVEEEQQRIQAAAQQPHSLTLRLQDRDFRITVDWMAENGTSGSGRVVHFQTDDSGLFFFFNEDNWELLVKVLDACVINDHYWVALAAATNVAYTAEVDQRSTGTVKEYSKRGFAKAPAIFDTTAFPCGEDGTSTTTTPGSSTTTAGSSTTTTSPGSSTTTTSSMTTVSTTSSSTTTTTVGDSISFSQDVQPIFSGEGGCTACHVTNSHQCDLNGATNGHLYLDGGGGGPHNQLVNEPVNDGCASAPFSVRRVNTASPEQSLVLRKPTNPQQNRPGDGSPPSPDVHEGGTILTKRNANDCQVGFVFANEPYCRILRWIQAGAPDN